MYVHPEDFMGARKSFNPNGWNAAHVGAQCGMCGGEGIKMLQKATPYEINSPDLTEGWTPLHWAVLSDNPKAAIWLLKNGADRDLEDKLGRKAEEMIDDHLGEFYQRYWDFPGAKKEAVIDPSKVMAKRIKQMKEAFKLNWTENEYDIEGYKMIEV